MQLHALQPTRARRSIKRIGRGGKRGTYSGRGVKGQKARAGHRIRPALRDLLKKFPKRRGYRFNTRAVRPQTLNAGVLEERFAPGDFVSVKTLARKNIIRVVRGRQPLVKILGDGILTKALIIEKIALSATAREKIEKAGGKVINE